MFLNRLKIGSLLLLAACGGAKKNASDSAFAQEPYRPQIHFSPATGWMNDPNGMVFYKGTYHLFYQHYPDSTVWGPMHWGHATSADLVHWQQQAIALYPDSLGYIFSGSAVVDSANSSGFGTEGKPPLVAIFTHHNEAASKTSDTFQYQSLAYSLDGGNTWVKYSGNPVLKNPGIKDFRDPKVAWYGPLKKWVMTLATLDHISFYSSPNLRDWTLESTFGKGLGAHGGVWECPDLFSIPHNGRPVWVLLVNLNPGGPNGGSATQYFTGSFDGKTFTPFDTVTRWLDYGPDEYAGITWSNTGARKIFMGWMSNWQYATVVPTKSWRSAMTVPRDLFLEKINNAFLLRSLPVPELDRVATSLATLRNLDATNYNLTEKPGALNGPVRIMLKGDALKNFALTLSNNRNENVVIGYDNQRNAFFIDRTASGNVSFERGFAGRHTAPRFATTAGFDLTLIVDAASVELFADGGLTAMTSIFFPTTPFTTITLQSPDGLTLQTVQLERLKSMYLPEVK